jgi:hypothetical protein
MSELMIGKTSDGLKRPVLVDSTGKIQVGGVQLDNLNVNTDQIEAKQDTTNAILTTQAADLAAVKAQLATGTIAVTGGGGGGGGASAAYNATLPTYTSGASSTLQTDVNGRLITTPTVQLGSGVVTSTTQRVTLAADGPEVTNSTAIKNNTANIPAKGAATTANSTPVNIASDQTVPVSVSSGTLTLTSSTNPTIGQYNSPLPTVSNGAYVAPQTDSSGKLLIQGGNSTAVAVSGTFWQTTQPVSGTVTSNRGSGSITLTATTAGTTSATLLAANAATKFLRVQNNSATATLYVSKVTPATSTNSIVIGPTTGANYYWEPGFIPTDTLYILASTASTPYTLSYA